MSAQNWLVVAMFLAAALVVLYQVNTDRNRPPFA
jgi:hypothetical protein